VYSTAGNGALIGVATQLYQDKNYSLSANGSCGNPDIDSISEPPETITIPDGETVTLTREYYGDNGVLLGSQTVTCEHLPQGYNEDYTYVFNTFPPFKSVSVDGGFFLTTLPSSNNESSEQVKCYNLLANCDNIINNNIEYTNEVLFNNHYYPNNLIYSSLVASFSWGSFGSRGKLVNTSPYPLMLDNYYTIAEYRGNALEKPLDEYHPNWGVGSDLCTKQETRKSIFYYKVGVQQAVRFYIPSPFPPWTVAYTRDTFNPPLNTLWAEVVFKMEIIETYNYS